MHTFCLLFLDYDSIKTVFVVVVVVVVVVQVVTVLQPI